MFSKLIVLIWHQIQVIPGFNCIVSVEKSSLSKSVTVELVFASIFHVVNSRADNWCPVGRWQKVTNRLLVFLKTNILGKRDQVRSLKCCVNNLFPFVYRNKRLLNSTSCGIFAKAPMSLEPFLVCDLIFNFVHDPKPNQTTRPVLT